MIEITSKKFLVSQHRPSTRPVRRTFGAGVAPGRGPKTFNTRRLLMQSTTVTCKNCGNHFEGEYCNICGEKIYHEHDKRFAHFIEEAFHFTTHFDSKIFRSFWLIFSKPGFLAQEFALGRRKKYFSPVSLFMV